MQLLAKFRIQLRDRFVLHRVASGLAPVAAVVVLQPLAISSFLQFDQLEEDSFFKEFRIHCFVDRLVSLDRSRAK